MLKAFRSLSAVLLLVGSSAVAEEVNVKFVNPGIRVGANVPLSGPLSSFGMAIHDGAVMALSDWEKKHASQPPVTFEWEDNQSEVKNAVTILKKQLASPPDVYVSGVKPQTAAIEADITKLGIAHFQWIFDVNVRDAGEGNNFRTWVNFKYEPPLFIGYAKEHKPAKVAIIYIILPNTEEEFGRYVVPGLEQLGIKDILLEKYQADQTDFGGIATKVRSFRPDLLIVSGFPEHLISLLKKLNDLQLVKGKHVLASYDLLDAASQLPPDLLEGIRVSAPKFVTRKNSDPKLQAWYAAFEQKYKHVPLYTHAFAYDMTSILLKAGEGIKPGEKVLPDIIRQRIQSVGLDGVTGKLKFDHAGDLPSSIELGVFRNGVPVQFDG